MYGPHHSLYLPGPPCSGQSRSRRRRRSSGAAASFWCSSTEARAPVSRLSWPFVFALPPGTVLVV